MSKTVARRLLLPVVIGTFAVAAFATTPSYKAIVERKKRTDVQSDSIRTDTSLVLGGVTVYGNSQKEVLMKSSQNNIQIDRNFLQVNFAGSLMQSLQGIPGVKAMNIGSGQSKPTIRGMGFNRMVVTEDGIKHEGQQWGDDHGLEIDQFSIDRIEIIKGPSALFYGSDAIGGGGEPVQ